MKGMSIVSRVRVVDPRVSKAVRFCPLLVRLLSLSRSSICRNRYQYQYFSMRNL